MSTHSLPQQYNSLSTAHAYSLRASQAPLHSYQTDLSHNLTYQASSEQNPLQQFSSFANEDVVMQAPLSENSFFMVPDTNILLRHLDTLRAFADDVERLKLSVVIVIPFAVVNELDWQKKDNWFSRKASLWLWDKIQEKKILKGQSRNEQVDSSRGLSNDDKIIDCALYFSQIRPTLLCSADRNLCINATVVAQERAPETLAIMNPADHNRWNPSILGISLFGPDVGATFTQWKPSYTSESDIVAHTEDDMDIDTKQDDNQLYQNDALSLLHSQVIDVFVGLLREVVASDQRDIQRQLRDGAAASMHAPSSSTSVHALKRDGKVSDMSLDDILEYVEYSPSGRLSLRQNNPLLNSFLSRPYQAHTGWRRGSDWSRQDWIISLRKLKKIGEAWGQRGEDITSTLRHDLYPHLQVVFCDDDIVI